MFKDRKKDGTTVITSGLTMDDILEQVGLLLHPVGSIEINTTHTNPGTYLGGTWIEWGKGRMIVGVDTAQTEFDTVEETGGSKTKTLVSHTHTFSGTTGGPSSTYLRTVGSNIVASDFHTHNYSGTTSGPSAASQDVLNPYITAYMWKRTA